MYFTTASLIARMLGSGRGKKFKVVEEYGFLWTEDEKKEMKKAELKEKMMKKVKK